MPLPRPDGLPDPETQRDFYAGVPFKRLLAWVVDVLVAAAITLLLAPVVLLATAFAGLFLLPGVFAAVSIAYRIATLASGSATWGMRLMAIELRGPDGGRLTPGLAVAHTLLFALASAAPPVQLLSAALMAFGPRGQGLGDLLLGTAAVNRMAAS